jgi:hypothetical protein
MFISIYWVFVYGKKPIGRIEILHALPPTPAINTCLCDTLICETHIHFNATSAMQNTFFTWRQCKCFYQYQCLVSMRKNKNQHENLKKKTSNHLDGIKEIEMFFFSLYGLFLNIQAPASDNTPNLLG